MYIDLQRLREAMKAERFDEDQIEAVCKVLNESADIRTYESQWVEEG